MATYYSININELRRLYGDILSIKKHVTLPINSVKTEMKLDGVVVDTETSTLSGGTASGTHELHVRNGHGKTYEVELTVTDTEGKSISETKDIVL